MSTWQTGRDAGLARLVEEGLEARHLSSHLLIEHVPYLNAAGEVHYGKLAAPITWVGNDHIDPPGDHVVWFQGEAPCGTNGDRLDLIHSEQPRDLFPGFHVDFMFSKKPASGYPDHYAKMTAYIAMLLGPAQAVDPTVTPNTFAKLPEIEEWSPFRFRDSATARAGISELNSRLRHQRIGIVGLGGTGSYILDLVAKTEVGEIHLIDGDEFINHNAFRAPGAASTDQVSARPMKVHHFATEYDRFRTGVVAHPSYVDASNTPELLDGLDFVFLAADHSDAITDVASWLRANRIPLIDVGIGISLSDQGLNGSVRTTLITPQTPADLMIPGGTADDEYAANIQVAEVNALNAALAVLRWKRLGGIYLDYQEEFQSTYSLSMNSIAMRGSTP